MNVLFLSPHYPPEMLDFTRGLAEVGAKVFSVADIPAGQLPLSTRRHIQRHLHVPNLLRDEESAAREILRQLRGVHIDRIETLWEPLVLLAARLRDVIGVEGLSRDTALLFRDKGLMKERLEAAGLPTPPSRRAKTAKEILDAAEEIGFPLIVKPIDGAGSANTYKVTSMERLEELLPQYRDVSEVSVELFIDGREFTYDAISIDNEPVFESVNEYLPRPLISRSEEWVSPAQVTYKNPYVEPMRKGIELGRAVLKALDRGTGFCHLEWYLTSSGRVYFGEIGARSGGGILVDQMNYSNDIDLFREWARVVCWRSFEATPTRKYHTATIFKRAQGQGRISHIEGISKLREYCGPYLVNEQLLPVGSPRRDWKQTLLSDGYLTLRHPKLESCLNMMNTAISKVHMFAN